MKVKTLEGEVSISKGVLSLSNRRPLIVVGLVGSSGFSVIISELLSAFTVEASLPVNNSRNLYVPAAVGVTGGVIITAPSFSQALLVKVAFVTVLCQPYDSRFQSRC